MASIVQFVDSIASSPTVRLDLNSIGGPLMVATEGINLSPPPYRRVVVSSMLTDGEIIPAAAYGNRTLQIPIRLLTSTTDAGATALQSLARELARPNNILKLQLDGATSPVFFRTFAAPDYSVTMIRLLLASNTFATLEIPAEPFALGLKETIAAVTVTEDPYEGATLNANPFFETNATNWTGTGGSIARSTAQAHQGSASLLLTPDGVSSQAYAESESAVVTGGNYYRATAWVRCNVARTISVAMNWFTSGGAYISTSGIAPVAVSATTWTLLDYSALAPATAGKASINVALSGTPSATHLTYIDEAKLIAPGGAGGMSFDVTGVKGDVETPLVLTLPAGNLYDSGDPISVLSVRRRGTPSNVPFVVQAEHMLLSTDTTLPGNDSAMSGTGSNYARTSFATNATMTRRVYLDVFPASVNADIRGRYRVFALLRKTVASGTVNVQLGYTSSTSPTLVLNDPVTADAVTGRCHLDLGLISFPTGLDPVTDGYSNTELPVKGRYIEIRAERIASTASLDFDYFLFVPADDNLALIDWGDANSTSDEFVIDSIHEMIYTQTTADEVYGSRPSVLAGGFPLVSPGVTNRFFWVRRAGRGATVTKTETTAISAAYWPRYLFIRPAST